jgi:hypothetical protein
MRFSAIAFAAFSSFWICILSKKFKYNQMQKHTVPHERTQIVSTLSKKKLTLEIGYMLTPAKFMFLGCNKTWDIDYSFCPADQEFVYENCAKKRLKNIEPKIYTLVWVTDFGPKFMTMNSHWETKPPSYKVSRIRAVIGI